MEKKRDKQTSVLTSREEKGKTRRPRLRLTKELAHPLKDPSKSWVSEGLEGTGVEGILSGTRLTT